MARNSSIITQGLQGAIGKKIVYKTINGKDIAAIYPDRTHVQFTKKQEEYQNIFKQAAAYASDVIHDPEKNREYIVKIRNGNKHKRAMSVYHYAMQEFLNRHSKKVHRDTIENTLKGYRKIFEPDEQETEVIKYLVAQGEMSNADYRRMTGVSKPTATRHLGAMVQKGLINGSSKGAGAVYTLVPLATK